jgi:hypothetical protein
VFHLQGSMLHALEATEVWARPLHDQTFAIVMLNKSKQPQNATLYISSPNWGQGENELRVRFVGFSRCSFSSLAADLFPARIDALKMRDVLQKAVTMCVCVLCVWVMRLTSCCFALGSGDIF